MKLLYELARALHMLLPKQIKVEAIKTGRLPKQVCIGTLGLSAELPHWGQQAYQMKLLKPSTKIATPVNCTTFVRSESNA
jgi:hypothetical protein